MARLEFVNLPEEAKILLGEHHVDRWDQSRVFLVKHIIVLFTENEMRPSKESTLSQRSLHYMSFNWRFYPKPLKVAVQYRRQYPCCSNNGQTGWMFTNVLGMLCCFWHQMPWLCAWHHEIWRVSALSDRSAGVPIFFYHDCTYNNKTNFTLTRHWVHWNPIPLSNRNINFVSQMQSTQHLLCVKSLLPWEGFPGSNVLLIRTPTMTRIKTLTSINTTLVG